MTEATAARTVLWDEYCSRTYILAELVPLVAEAGSPS